uniref:Uncharacterized protein n=1 Tax=Cacopsylla melanoneura TaxID=428564 RepID=A0A8D8YDS4_9HEMI
MDPEEPPIKKRKTKESTQSPKPKKLKVKPFAKDVHFNKTLEIKQEINSDHEQGSQETQYNEENLNRLTASCISEDDEVWIVQCPIDMDPSSLIGESLTFSETCTVTDTSTSKQYDVDSMDSSPKKFQCILPKGTQAGLEICNLNVKGMLILSESTSGEGSHTQETETDMKENIILPPNVKVRNPHLSPDEIHQLKPAKTPKKKSKKC